MVFVKSWTIEYGYELKTSRIFLRIFLKLRFRGICRGDVMECVVVIVL